MSISIGCWLSQHEGSGRDGGDLQGAGAAIEAQSPLDVSRRGGCAAIAHPGVVDGGAVVGPWPSDTQPECAGHGGFGPSCIWGPVVARVAQDGAYGLAWLGARGQDGCEDEPECGEAGRWEVDEVIEACGGPAEAFVAWRSVTDHAVGGVGRFVEGHAGQPGDAAPHGRGNDAVGEVFSQAFDGGAGYRVLIEGVWVSPDDVADGGAGVIEALVQAGRDGGDVVREAAAGEEAAGQDGGQKQAAGGLDEEGRQGGGEQNRREREAAGEARAGQPAIEGGDEGADPDDGVADHAEECLRVAEGGLDEERGCG